MTDRICPVKGCFVPIRRDRNMCLAHWRRVPKALQEEVWDAWSAYQNASKNDARAGLVEAIMRLRSAQRAAKEAVEKVEKKERTEAIEEKEGRS